jgi:uncharacterized protein (DUF342 family)
MAECVLCINPYDGQLCLVWKALTSTAPSYLDAEIDVQLSSEITGALRSLKCEGSLARDRYKSLQKRNIIEPRERIRSHRKYKLKVKEKRSKRLPEEIGASYFHSRK